MYNWKLQDTDEINGKKLMKKYIHAHGLEESILFSKEIYKFNIIPIRISMALFT